MIQLQFEQRIVVARVLNRYAVQVMKVDWNKPVLAALQKWIDTGSKAFGTRSPPNPVRAFGPTTKSA